MISLPILILSAAALFSPVYSAWTNTTLLVDFDIFTSSILNVYRDPSTSVSHVIIGVPYLSHYLHLAVSDNGTILFRTRFVDPAAVSATIRGTGDGHRLFLALSSSAAHVVNFTESSDGGKTWAAPIAITKSGRYISDMVYIPATRRIYVFFTTPNEELRMASRAAGSIIFSPEGLVAKGVLPGFDAARAGYANLAIAVWLGAAYVNATDRRLMLTTSVNFGVSWDSPKAIGGLGETIRSVSSLLSGPRFGPSVFVAYISASSSRARLVRSQGFGLSFGPPVSMTNESTNANHIGLSGCVTEKSMMILSSLYPVFEGLPTYAIWNGSDTRLTPEIRRTPYWFAQTEQTGVDCAVDHEGVVRVSTFVTMRRGESCMLYFAVDSVGDKQIDT